MAYNPNYKLVHIKTIPEGYEYCEFKVKETSDEDRKLLTSEKDVYDLLIKVDKP